MSCASNGPDAGRSHKGNRSDNGHENIKGNIPPFMVRGDGGLRKDSVILLHQIRVVDES